MNRRPWPAVTAYRPCRPEPTPVQARSPVASAASVADPAHVDRLLVVAATGHRCAAQGGDILSLANAVDGETGEGVRGGPHSTVQASISTARPWASRFFSSKPP